MLITLTIIPLIYKEMIKFHQKQVKSETFVVAVRNLILTDGALVIGLITSIIGT